MEITLTDGRTVNILMIETAKNYVDYEFQDVPGHCRSDFTFVSFMTIEADIKAAIEADMEIS